MKIIANRVRLSATDLANHVACVHLTTLDLAVEQQRLIRPQKTAWLPASLQQRGEAHERAYVDALRSRYDRMVDLETRGSTSADFARPATSWLVAPT